MPGAAVGVVEAAVVEAGGRLGGATINGTWAPNHHPVALLLLLTAGRLTSSRACPRSSPATSSFMASSHVPAASCSNDEADEAGLTCSKAHFVTCPRKERKAFVGKPVSPKASRAIKTAGPCQRRSSSRLLRGDVDTRGSPRQVTCCEPAKSNNITGKTSKVPGFSLARLCECSGCSGASPWLHGQTPSKQGDASSWGPSQLGRAQRGGRQSCSAPSLAQQIGGQ